MSARPQPKFDLTVPAESRAVHQTVETIMQAARGMNAVNGKDFELELALTEAVANAIVHGCGNDPAKKVEISMTSQDGDLVISIRDPGPGFDPTKLPDPREGENVLRTSGRGVHLITQLVDEVEFIHHTGAKPGTEVRIRNHAPRHSTR